MSIIINYEIKTMNICRNNRICGNEEDEEGFQRQMDDAVVPGRANALRGTLGRAFTIGKLGHEVEVAGLYNRDKLKFADDRTKFIDPFMHEDSRADDFLESVKQTVPLSEIKQVLRSSYFD